MCSVTFTGLVGFPFGPMSCSVSVTSTLWSAPTAAPNSWAPPSEENFCWIVDMWLLPRCGGQPLGFPNHPGAILSVIALYNNAYLVEICTIGITAQAAARRSAGARWLTLPAVAHQTYLDVAARRFRRLQAASACPAVIASPATVV